ncbi:rna polymerase sigma factor 70 region 4 type 2 [Lucifera butyrica]|uniref:Rna polymerase sigma factor 70 region 4 type 2 n=1 Tax=Lucifera butyrica TaxID=1351585 RepID=A0A498R8N9_9FIRM|nr:sigma-70 family RNA polymerase sigma factor [Lucifera butyrica]VBB09066.1 rna polymerase sigma factor 70 region 4 type 2 [Lucifera butyrica]
MDDHLRELVEGARGGNKKDFAVLVQRFQNRVFAVAFGIAGNREDAEDIAQETFIKAYKNVAKLNNADGFYKWLLRIAVTTGINYKKRPAATKNVSLGDVAEPAYQGETPEEYAEKREAREKLYALLAELTAEHRAVLVMREIEDLSYDEIAGLLQIPLGTVKSRINHAREKLRQGLARGEKNEMF